MVKNQQYHLNFGGENELVGTPFPLPPQEKCVKLTKNDRQQRESGKIAIDG